MTTHDESAGDPPALSPTRRETWLRRQRRRALVLATVSTVVSVGVTIALVTTASGWPRVRQLFFNGARFKKDLPDLLGFLWIDVKLFVVCVPFIMIWALVLATWRNTRNPVFFPLRIFAAAYTDVFRGVPIILTIYLIGFGIPALRLITGEFHRPPNPSTWNEPLSSFSAGMPKPTR